MFTITDGNISEIRYKTHTKVLEYLYKGNHNLIRAFIEHFEYIIQSNDPIGDDWVHIGNEKFNELCIMDYHYFSRLRKAGLATPPANSNNLIFKTVLTSF